jgi:hypothetical protein
VYLSTRFRVRALGALGAATGLATLSGCQNHKIVARVNGTPINDDEYQTFVSHVRAPDFTALTAQGVQTDAGGAGMASVVKEKLLEKLATEKNALPNDDAVTQYQDYVMHTNPAFPTAIAMGQVTTEELHRIIRDQMILVALGTNNANVPEDEIKKEFDAHKDQYNYPEMVGLQVAPVPDQTTGIELINQIRSTGDFGKSAAKYSPQATVVRYIVVNERFPAPLKDALAPLKDNQLAPAPIAIPNPSGGSANIVVKLVKRMPKQDVTLAQAHQAVVQRRLQETQPQLLQHSQEVINEYNQKATVEVLVDQYKSVVTSALMPPPVSPMGMGGSGQGGAMAPGAGGPAAGGPGVPRRVMPRMGAGIPRQSSGAPAPNGGTAAPTPNAHP